MSSVHPIDRVVIHQALKHLVVAGNSLIFMGKEGLKTFRSIDMVERDGNGTVTEIVTKELIDRKLLQGRIPRRNPMKLVLVAVSMAGLAVTMKTLRSTLTSRWTSPTVAGPGTKKLTIRLSLVHVVLLRRMHPLGWFFDSILSMVRSTDVAVLKNSWVI